MNREQNLLTWVKGKHAGQIIKRTTEPYVNHLIKVAEIAKVTRLGYEIGLCHDLLEDTETTGPELKAALACLGYTEPESNFITACAVELTDVFTVNAYPELSKAERKEKEAARLITISPTAQTVKYADLMDNIAWVLKHDQKKALSYLQKKLLLLTSMAGGDNALRTIAIAMINQALNELKPI